MEVDSLDAMHVYMGGKPQTVTLLKCMFVEGYTQLP